MWQFSKKTLESQTACDKLTYLSLDVKGTYITHSEVVMDKINFLFVRNLKTNKIQIKKGEKRRQ